MTIKIELPLENLLMSFFVVFVGGFLLPFVLNNLGFNILKLHQKPQTQNICTCGHEKEEHSSFRSGKCMHFDGLYDCPCKKFQPRKSKLFPSKQIKGMLTDGQGAYYPDEPPQKKQVTLPSVVVSEEIRE